MPRIVDKPSAGLAMTHRQIARALGVSYQRVHQAYQAGIRKLWNAGMRARAKRRDITARRDAAAIDGR